jgi:UDP-N-acetylmuramoyl-L-alanyl-D-glutamate--2,6-diaminopimelate ligase
VYTNLSANEHLDFHGTLEAYRAAKLRLFSEYLERDGTAVINADDAHAEAFIAVSPKVLTYGLDAKAQLQATQVESSLRGNRFELRFEGMERRVELPLPGRVNVHNALGAFGAALALGVPLAEVVEAAPELQPVRGRLEPVRQGQPFEVFVDFAHTPAALEGLLSFVRSQTHGRLIVCFGCGGDRDRSKRPLMGRAAARYADEVVLTSDNPRSEDPEAILDEIVPGLGKCRHHRQVDRREAIALALGLARPGDVVILAGKGHETTQEVAGTLLPFDDRAVAGRILEEMGTPA